MALPMVSFGRDNSLLPELMTNNCLRDKGIHRPNPSDPKMLLRSRAKSKHPAKRPKAPQRK
ncbi:hypothetical protein DPMN_180604 [Dreissena polymorpha]|uniref:Uncharacterized protein n=1 Tax=Dreissena polymorpha TaxID=45954 RepID=A0A9D4EGG7_DREPO|nr:hypothetical protein DPMN_044643 [Dreissena polymorpha]KAH3779125.1 hypothetical protein DPMN_180604 [Dreissena polymorpha]